ncbi:hypothetical protein EHI8A_148840 [Entamoeba histolytica HM-1:IMSS-B]|uniref:Uncharacterized protein n=4 Tax=Entamoeba histolytica TaxID=5759 RepID=C4M4J7_ENTH1|nr:hypothetical protein EHI_138810 [Entamoeba histolytica HM-1:IMSS]EAL46250.1 hypothetical protein EHI_138810 [Entamoeba histolytica HM-1:IMSS]EMH75903.1 hypothetical protein EHI8A_148840 [Entamoeba histolytica HM-1:IMSS-B]ENY60475.1 hypothetical protein EHI7A_134390 [Entamoeba histolytica HM-1:IMSS-A]GAT96286.1 hypothetical protein CL6EHI_138810 [Entamoeba histolytica]|eukprot:XP_651639.1 hypothetical protein EHI_138810 [Entamoeba histolytica HM-1:IMSS]
MYVEREWTVVEQLVLVESIDYYFPHDYREWRLVSELVIKTMSYFSHVNVRLYSPDECFSQWTVIEKKYLDKVPPECSLLKSIILILRNKRIEELDTEIQIVKQRLLHFKQMS